MPGVPEAAWRQVSVSAQECIGAQRCKFGSRCFAEQAREAAARADIVVTNHALLAIDATSDIDVLPEHDVVIVDEAHDLVDRVTSATTGELSGVAVDTINKSKTDMVASLQALAPTLQQLANAGQALPQSLQVLLTYPFTDQVLKDIKGDYLNAYLSVQGAPGTTVIAPVKPPATATPTPTVTPQGGGH